MNHDKEAAKSYIEQLTGNANSIITFQTFWDSGLDKKSFLDKMKTEGKKPFDPKAKIIVGTLDKVWDDLRKRNEQGAGIFAAINEMNGTGRSNKAVKKIRALAADNDGDGIVVAPHNCSFTVNSKRGQHSYWTLQNDLPPEEFKKYQKRIAEKLGTDRSISDCARVLRVPGFFHLKEAESPFLVRLGEVSSRRYSLEEIENLFPEDSKKSGKIPPKFIKWFNSLPIEEGSQNPTGGRNQVVMMIAREGLALNISMEDLETFIIEYCEKSELDPTEGLEVMHRQRKYHDESPFYSNLKNRSENENNFLEMAMKFAKSKYGDGNQINALLMNEDLYCWSDGVYIPRAKNNLKYDVTKYFQEQDEPVNNSIINNVVTQVEGAIHTREQIQPGEWFNEKKENRFQISLQNGLLLIPSNFEASKVKLVSHTPKCFTLSKLDFKYDPEAKCPNFDKILKESLGEEEKINLVWEWFGYNLIYDTRMAKAIIFLGEGANGKSVLMTVQGQLIGEENFSSISLDAFDPKRTFMLAATKGKLANLCEDMNEINKVAEGMVKSFISGGKVQVEEKFKPSYSIWPTARLTFATNSLPRFLDGTDGIYRRFIILEFPNQILDESKQNKNFIDPEWWKESGELPGVLNKSLLGLEKLMKRGKFLEPESSKALRETYRDESNSGRMFLKENFERANQSSEVFSSDVYNHYRQYCQEHGYIPKGSAKFQEDVRRLFPEVKRSTSMRKSPDSGKRSYVLTGLKSKWPEDSAPF